MNVGRIRKRINIESSYDSIIYIVIKTLLYGNPVQGWASTISIILLLGGIQLLSIGILGQYIGKTYTEIKNRPIFIIKETNINKVFES